MKIEQVFNVCSVYSQRNYLISADYSNAYQSRGYPLRKKYSNNAIKIADNSEIAINGIEYLVIPNIKTFMFRVLYVYIFLSNGLKGIPKAEQQSSYSLSTNFEKL